MKRIICIDPGHGMGNRRPGVYDPGATVNAPPPNGGKPREYSEAVIVMMWADMLRTLLMAAGHKVIRTRVDAADPAPVGRRSEVARKHGCDVFVSLHCNAANGVANGTETFYRGPENLALATRANDAVVAGLGTRNRGVKTEQQSQHSTLAVLAFPVLVWSSWDLSTTPATGLQCSMNPECWQPASALLRQSPLNTDDLQLLRH